MNRNTVVALALGIVIGAIATSFYWHKSQERSKFTFDHNVKCQQIAKQYEADNNGLKVQKVAYSYNRDSCVAEVFEPHRGEGIDFTVQDLLSGEQLWYGRYKTGENLEEKLKMLGKEQDAKFSSFAR